jgi:hypothetical protein
VGRFQRDLEAGEQQRATTLHLAAVIAAEHLAAARREGGEPSPLECLEASA